MKNVLFCFSNFIQKNIPLQPWLTVFEIAQYLLVRGCCVGILTDVEENVSCIKNINIHYVKSLRNSNYISIVKKIEKINPDFIFVSVTPFSLFFNSWYKKLRNYNSYCFASYPFYGYNEVNKIFFDLSLHDKFQYGKNLLIHNLLWSRNIKKNFCGMICQSEHTKTKIKKKSRCGINIYSILPGIDKKKYKAIKYRKLKGDKTIFVYAGSLLKIRGFELIVKVFNLLDTSDIVLKILARGSDDHQISKIKKMFSLSPVDVEVYGGWLDKCTVANLIASADVTLLPFLLIPSELPVTVMESVSLGTPVIVSNIAGLPEVAGDAGLVVDPGRGSSLLDAVQAIHSDRDLLLRLRRGCIRQRELYLDWNETASLWLRLMENGKI